MSSKPGNHTTFGRKEVSIGIRMALGARRGEILGLVIRQGMWLTGGGVLVGLAAALALSQLLRSQLFQVSPFDPLTFGLTAT